MMGVADEGADNGAGVRSRVSGAGGEGRPLGKAKHCKVWLLERI